MPLSAYLILRNCTEGLRKRYLYLFAYMGRTTLETYIFQFHIWMRTTGLNEALSSGSRFLLAELCRVNGHLHLRLHQIFAFDWSAARCAHPIKFASHAVDFCCFVDCWGSLLDPVSNVDWQHSHAWTAVKTPLKSAFPAH